MMWSRQEIMCENVLMLGTVVARGVNMTEELTSKFNLLTSLRWSPDAIRDTKQSNDEMLKKKNIVFYTIQFLQVNPSE